MTGLRTEFDFVLPKGYVDDEGRLHREGTMRLATARDEIEPLRDRGITDADDPYLTVMVLARVVTSLGTIDDVGTDHIEGLFAADLAFLQDLYGIVNFGDPADVDALLASVAPVDDVEPATPDDEPDVADAIDDESPQPAPRRAGGSRSRIEEVPSSSAT